MEEQCLFISFCSVLFIHGGLLFWLSIAVGAMLGVWYFHSLLECLNLAIHAFLRATFAFAMHTLFGCPSCPCGFFFSFTFLLVSMDKIMGLGLCTLRGEKKDCF